MFILWVSAVIVFFIFLEAFFSGSEMAIISVNRIKLEQLAQNKLKQAVLLKKMLAFPDRLLSTTLVGTNLSVVISVALFTALLRGLFGEVQAWVTPVVMTPLILIFAEAVPKVVFRHYADKVTFRIAKLLRFFSIVFWPIVALTSFFSKCLLLEFWSKKKVKKSLFVTREELKLLIKESKQDQAIKPHEHAIIYRIFEFGSKKVKEIAVGMQNIVSISAQDSLRRLKEASKASGFSRVLVYKHQKTNLIGFANVFDALYEPKKFNNVSDCLRPVLYVSGETPIDKVFYTLQLKRMQVAVLVDEKQKHIGIVTFKDLLDEIAGEA